MPGLIPGDPAITGTVSWLLQEDISVIGWKLAAEIELSGVNYSDGFLIGSAEFSRTAEYFADAVLDLVEAKFECEAHAVSGLIRCQLGERMDRSAVMLPPGHEVHIDDGEYLYLNYMGVNGMTLNHNAACWLVIYYKER